MSAGTRSRRALHEATLVSAGCLAVVTLLASRPSGGEEAPPPPPIPPPTESSFLEKPCTGSDDWIRLTSSEWLKGDVRRMRSQYVDFWSREMKSQSIKWRKVVDLCLAEEARFVTRGYRAYVGRGAVRNDTVIVETAQGQVRFPRKDLTGILPGRDREIDRWGISLGVGINADQGNTDQVSLNLNGALKREDRFSRGEISYSGSYGMTNQVETIHRHRLDNSFDWYFSRQLYWTVLDMPIFHDEFQNIGARISPSTGPGWQIFEQDGLEWSVETGIGYQYSSFISVQPPQRPQASDMLVRFSTDFSWDIVSDLELKLSHSSTLVPTDLGLTSLYTQVKLEYELTWLLKLETTLVHNRVFDPVPLANGTRPKPDDVQLIFGFSLSTY